MMMAPTEVNWSGHYSTLCLSPSLCLVDGNIYHQRSYSNEHFEDEF